MLAKNHILAIVLISICAVLAVTFGCVFGLNNASPKTDLNTSVNAATYTSGNYVYTYTSGSGTCTIKANSSSKPTGAITLPSSVTISGATYTVTGITSVSSYSSGAFYNCTGITSVTIPSTITSIGNHAFYNCTGIKSVTLYSGLKTIGTNAFQGCSAMTSITIPSSVTSIGGSAFYNCSKITSISIPDTVTTIAAYTFYGCSGIKTLTIGTKVTSIGDFAFNNCAGITTFNYNATSVTDFASDNRIFYKAGRSGSGFTLNIGSNVTKIPAYFLYPDDSDYYPLVTSIVFKSNSSCSSIGGNAFSYCIGLKTVTLPDCVTTFKGSVFSGCTGLTTLKMKNKVLRSSEYSYDFSSCSALVNLYVDDIADYCESEFGGTYGYPFYNTAGNGNCSLYVNNSKVSSLTVSASTIFPNAFCGLSQLTSVNIADSVSSIGNNAFSGCANITKVTIGSGTTSIGGNAFYSCTSLKEVTIGSGVTSIGEAAFRSCSALTSVYFLQLANFSVGSNAFYQNSSLCAYYFVSQDILNTIKTNYNTDNTSYFTNTNFYLCCVISFESNGGSSCVSQAFISGSSYGSLPTPTREGYRFAGWYTNSALTGSAVSTSTTASVSHTLYAKWTFDGIDVVVSGASTSLSSSSVEMDEYNATVIVKPKAGYYISEFSFDNSVFIPVECYTTSIRDIPFAWSVTYYASKANNRLIFSFEYVDLDCLENGQLATIYLKTTTTPYASLKETTGAISISGVAVSATLGGSVTLIGDAYESLADSDTITCVAKVCVPGYEFDGWYSADDMETCLSDADSKRFTKTEIYEKQIIAVFKPIENTSVNEETSN